MNNIDPTRLARLRPEKPDDLAVKEQISLIQKTCRDVDPEQIALVFHECDYNMQQTIARIQAGDFEAGGWQTAKANNKKKNHDPTDHLHNGGILSDSERSLSQRTSPTSSLRGRHHQYSSSTRPNTVRRQNDPTRNPFPPRYSSRHNQAVSSFKPTNSFERIPSEISSPPNPSVKELSHIVSPTIDEYVFVDSATQSSSFENSQKKASSKHSLSIPSEPVSMHSTVQFSTEPIDIQFGDIQWNDSIPTAVSPSNTELASTMENKQHDNIPATVNTHEHRVHNTFPSNLFLHSTTTEIDNQLVETTNQLSSSSFSLADNTISNNVPEMPPVNTSHLSDHLTSVSSLASTHQPASIQIPITRLPHASTPRAPDYTSPISQFVPSNLQQNTNGVTPSAFTPVQTLGNYPSLPRDYSQAALWNAQSVNYKPTSKTAMIPAGPYQQHPAYQLPPQQQQQQQQQIFVQHYPYPPGSPALVQVFAPLEHWSTAAGFPTALEPYQYATANYLPTYSAPQQQQPYHPSTKYEQQIYDKDFFAHYGQTRSSVHDPSSSPSQSTKDAQVTSKLSPTAATFSQGAPLAASPSATALYINPMAFPVPNYFQPPGASTHPQDRTVAYSSFDNRDNRNGASHTGTNNRNHYNHHGQQRPYNNNGSNSTWHTQQQ